MPRFGFLTVYLQKYPMQLQMKFIDYYLVTNGFSQGQIGIFSTYLNKEPAIVREMILLDDSAEIRKAVEEKEAIQMETDAALVTMLANCTSKEEEFSEQSCSLFFQA